MTEVIHVRRILCPVDFSQESTGAMLYATQVASLFSAETHLLHATVVQGFGFLDAYPSCGILESTIQNRAEVALNRLLVGPSAAHLQVRRAVKTGEAPAQVILDYVEAQQIDLVVMATHGRRGPRKMFLGGVTEEVVRFSDVPVLTVSGGITLRGGPQGRILACVDDKSIAQEIVETAGRFASWTDSEVLLAHVIDPGSNADKEQEFARLRSLVENAGLDPAIVSYKVTTGRATESILEIAEHASPDLIVLGSDRRTPDGTLLGSVAERVLQRANRSVLTLKVPHEGQAHAGKIQTSA